MSTVKANTYLAASGSPTEEPSIPALDQRMAKAWIEHDMANTAILSSYGVSSVTDVAVGKQRINLSSAMSSTNYAVLGTTYLAGSGITCNLSYYQDTTTSFTTLNKINTAYADYTVSFVVFGN